MIKTGIIGCGYWGPKWARNFHEVSQADLKMVCDFKQDRLDHLKSLYPYVETSRDYRELLTSDVEAVVIATPVSTHHRLALECLQAGKHVLVEKPIASCSKEAEEIIGVAEEQERILMVGHTFEYNPAVEAVRDVIASGELGRIYYINATRVNLGLFQQDINVIWDLAPHDLSILVFILGMEPDIVSARGNAYVQKGIHDVAYVTVYFPDGTLADIRVSWLDPCKIRRVTVVGSKKMLVYDDVEPENKVLIYDKGVEVPPYSDTVEEFHLSYRYGDITPYPIQWVEPLKVECLHFLECIRGKKHPRSDGYAGLKVVKILEAAQRSLLNGGLRENIVW